MLTPKQKSKKAHLALQALRREAERIGLTRDKYYFDVIPSVTAKMPKSERTYKSEMTVCYYKFTDSPKIRATIAVCSRKDGAIYNNGKYHALERLYRYFKVRPHALDPITKEMISGIDITDATTIAIDVWYGPELESLVYNSGSGNSPYDLTNNFVAG